MNNLYVFHGADRKVGVTMVAQSAAEYAAGAAPEADVLLLTLNGRQNVQYLREEAPPIDSYKSRIDSGIKLTKREIEKHKAMDNLYIISGIKKETEERFYLPETAGALLSDLESQFEIIIADTGSDLDNGLALGGLTWAREKYMILSQNEATLTRYERNRELYKSLGILFDKFIVNKYSRKDPYTTDYIGKRLELPKEDLMRVQLTSLGRQAEMEYKTLMDFKEDGYIRDIEAVALNILESSGIALKSKRKSKWKSFI